MSIPPGGPATINGVLFQMLWCLLQAVKLRVSNLEIDETTGEVGEVRLVLEPDGGDAWVGKRIIQLKSRSSSRPWSLQEVVSSIFPDLYRAVDLSTDGIHYEFVTEAEVGDWREVLRFFQSLPSSLPDGVSTTESLNDHKVVYRPRRGRISAAGSAESTQSAFWTRESYTERTLFEFIVDVVRKHSPAAGEERELTCAKLHHMLSRFSIDVGWSMSRLQREIDSLLLAIVPSDMAVLDKRREMIAHMAELASKGSAEVDVLQFLSEHQLAAIPLSPHGWERLRSRSRAHLRRRLDVAQIEPEFDARPELVDRFREQWARTVPIGIISGESGQGKSWTVHQIAMDLAVEPALVVALDATGEFEKTLERARRIFIEQIWNADDGPPLVRIGARIRQLVKPRSNWWLTLLLDNVQDHAEARAIARYDWQSVGIRVVLCGSPSIEETIRSESGGRSTSLLLRDFSSQELERYLRIRCDRGWIEIPSNVRETLKRPLLAALFTALAAEAEWHPTTEYELYERYWQRLYTSTVSVGRPR